ncbi:MAG TPA: hypothetical protein VE869_14850 [Gemmatimonas sp.]|nr:hypothetical protein [Gemmatimonas sp.]
MIRTLRRWTRDTSTLVRIGVAIVAFAAFPFLAAGQAPPAVATPQGAATADVTPEMIARAQMDGRAAAMNAGGWFGRSVVIGVATGLIGTAVTVGVAGGSGVELPPEQKVTIARQPLLVQQTFEKSYADAVRSKRKSSSWKGGLLGTAAFVVLLLSSSGSSQ